MQQQQQQQRAMSGPPAASAADPAAGAAAAVDGVRAVVDGVRVPLHSQVLGAQSQVLRGLFLSLKEGAISAEVCGALCWRCACWLTMGIPPALPLPALHTPPIRIRFFRCVAAGGAYCQCRLISSFSKCHCARRRLLPAPDLLPR